NDTAIDEPYLADDIVGSDIEFDVTVPDGKLWVMGDHRNESGDSRAHMDGPNDGFVDIDTVVGRAVIVACPLGRWGPPGSDNQPFEHVPAPYWYNSPIFQLKPFLQTPVAALLSPAWMKLAEEPLLGRSPLV